GAARIASELSAIRPSSTNGSPRCAASARLRTAARRSGMHVRADARLELLRAEGLRHVDVGAYLCSGRDVEDREVRPSLARELERLGAAARGHDLVSGALEPEPDEREDVGVVVGDENEGAGHASKIGSVSAADIRSRPYAVLRGSGRSLP